MNKNKIFSVFTAVIMCFCAILSAFPASAASNGNNNKKYTLEELFAMSKEEFLSLKCDISAETCYEAVKWDANYHEVLSGIEAYGGISGLLFIPFNTAEDYKTKYTANVTEMELEKLLGNTVKYVISPPNMNVDRDSMEYNYNFFVYFPEFEEGYSETHTISDERIVEFAKCVFCANQVSDFQYSGSNDAFGDFSSSGIKIIDGDVNLDMSFDLYDVIWIAKSLINEFELTEAQVLVADTNGDGVADLHDAVNLAKKLMK